MGKFYHPVDSDCSEKEHVKSLPLSEKPIDSFSICWKTCVYTDTL